MVANFLDGDANAPETNGLQVSGPEDKLNVTLIGPRQRQGVSTECTVETTEVGTSGLEGTFTCRGEVTGTFEAH